jgi:membrane peptidoglycan carboxypeptidase
MVRPHVVFPDQLNPDFRKSLLESFPGSGDAYFPIDPENWLTVTDGMYEVTQPAYFHTAGSAHLEGIDFGGKTGTAQLMSHEALGKTTKGRITYPNVWFVGVTPRRNPELVVAVLWQNGEFSYYPARIGAKVVSAYVEKQRRLAHNLVQPKTDNKADKPTEMSAVWTVPNPSSAIDPNAPPDRVQSGHFLVDHGQIVASNAPKPAVPPKPNTPRAPSMRRSPVARVGNHELQPAVTARPANLGAPSMRRSPVAWVGDHETKPTQKPETPAARAGQ